MSNTSQQKFKINNRYELRTVKDKIILVMKNSHFIDCDFIISNKTGQLLLKSLKTPKTLEELTSIITKKYKIDYNTANIDISAFLKKMSSREIINII